MRELRWQAPAPYRHAGSMPLGGWVCGLALRIRTGPTWWWGCGPPASTKPHTHTRTHSQACSRRGAGRWQHATARCPCLAVARVRDGHVDFVYLGRLGKWTNSPPHRHTRAHAPPPLATTRGQPWPCRPTASDAVAPLGGTAPPCGTEHTARDACLAAHGARHRTEATWRARSERGALQMRHAQRSLARRISAGA